MLGQIADLFGKACGFLIAGLIFYFVIKFILLLFLKGKSLYITSFILSSLVISAVYYYLNGLTISNIFYIISVLVWFLYDWISFKKKDEKNERSNTDLFHEQ